MAHKNFIKHHNNFSYSGCTNCGNKNHDFKECNQPITSWGVILINLSEINEKIYHNNVNIKSHIYNIAPTTFNDLNIIGNVMNSIKFLLVQRKHSIGFVDFIRGKYKVDNIDNINFLFQHMIPDEINNIAIKSFDELWCELWNEDITQLNPNKKDYAQAKEKFTQLKENKELDVNLDFYVNNVKPLYQTNEWGFPKGRKSKNETNRECAIREFLEETNISADKIKIIDNIEPIEELMTGTNGIKYKHIYYIAETYENIEISVEGNDEIGNIKFLTFNDGINIIRDYHNEKKEVLTSVYYYYLETILNCIKK